MALLVGWFVCLLCLGNLDDYDATTRKKMRVHLANWSLLSTHEKRRVFLRSGPSATQDVPELVERKIRNQIEQQQGALQPRTLANGSRAPVICVVIALLMGYKTVQARYHDLKGHGIGNAK